MWNDPGVTPGMRGKKFSTGPSVFSSVRNPGWFLAVVSTAHGRGKAQTHALDGVHGTLELDASLDEEEGEDGEADEGCTVYHVGGDVVARQACEGVWVQRQLGRGIRLE